MIEKMGHGCCVHVQGSEYTAGLWNPTWRAREVRWEKVMTASRGWVVKDYSSKPEGVEAGRQRGNF